MTKKEAAKKEVKAVETVKEEVQERYTVVQTILDGPQSTKSTVNSTGETKVTPHRKPIGYALKDNKTGSIQIWSHVETAELVNEYGATNVMVTATKRLNKKSGEYEPSAYIRTKGKHAPVQSPEYVVQMKDYFVYEAPAEKGKKGKVTVKDNPEIKISAIFTAELIQKFSRTRRSGGGKAAEPKYSPSELAEAIARRKAELEASLKQ